MVNKNQHIMMINFIYYEKWQI